MIQKDKIYWAILVVSFFIVVDLMIWANLDFLKNYPVEKIYIVHQEKNQQQQQIMPYTLEVVWQKELVGQQQYDKEDFKYYLAGKIINGSLKDENIYLEVENGMGGGVRHYSINNNQIVYFDGYYGVNEQNKNFTIKGINDSPEQINFPNSDYKLNFDGKSYLFKDLKITKKVFTDKDLGDFYLTEDGYFASESPDHTAVIYYFEYAFLNKENGALNLTFNNGQINNEEYPNTRIDQLISDSDLVTIGRTETGEIFYELKDQQYLYLKNLYNNENTVAYENGENKYSYQEFINFHPLLYWKDPINRWIEFRNRRFDSAAEMGKPVIYFYPKQKTILDVKVAPNGGFTETIPPYNDGWKIEAYPDSKIIDLKTGEKYNYLFWSGMALNYPPQDEGWVVKKEFLNLFFDEKLELVGLNDNEIDDFKDYWLNRLNERPYYQISFLFNDIVDQLAPLEISPIKPDQIIRIMMTAKGLDELMTITEQKLPIFGERIGFTVVEWGGMLLK